MTVYYNEIDDYAAQWLRNLIAAGLIADGVVDERSILDVKPDDLAEFVQCHFFAGIGVWSHALRQAEWPDDRPVWTGSCPCQPFSTAGKQAGVEDERHLWPIWNNLINECRPPVVFGEQVAAAIGHSWLDTLQTDLEAQDYAVGAAVLGAHSVGAPHIRQRLYFVADNNNKGLEGYGRHVKQHGSQGWQKPDGHDWPRSVPGRLANHDLPIEHERTSGWEQQVRQFRETGGYWSDADWLYFRDGKIRPVEPGTFPLVNGIAGRVGRLRAYGNAIVPQVAQTFIEAFLETRP